MLSHETYINLINYLDVILGIYHTTFRVMKIQEQGLENYVKGAMKNYAKGAKILSKKQLNFFDQKKKTQLFLKKKNCIRIFLLILFCW